VSDGSPPAEPGRALILVEWPSMPAEKNQVESLDVPEDFYERIEHDIRARIAARLSFAHHVVDLGCGSCELARFLARENAQHVVGVDIYGSGFSEEPGGQGSVECREADARRLEFIYDDSVDAALSAHALHEMQEPLEVLREARRVLRSGGEILVVDFPRDSLAQRLWNESYLTPTEVVELLRKAGFTDVECRLIAQGQLIWAEGRKGPAGKEMA